MAKVNFNNIDEVEQSNTNNGSGNDVGFFTLKNDNDEAIVRFMCDSVDDFEILTVHDIQLGQRYRKVNCIRDPREPLDNCPLCKSGARISNRFFIKLLQYNKVTDPNTGAVTIQPAAMIWERSTAYAKTLKSYIDNYGPMSDIICKIIRHGKAGDMQTTYEIVPNLSKMIYKDEIYVKDTSLLGNFEAFGTIVMDKTFDELNQFVATGEFPVRQAPTTDSATTPEITPRTYDPNAGANMAPQTPPAPQFMAAPTSPQYAAVDPSFNVNPSTPSTPTYQPTPVANPVAAPTPSAASMPWNNPSQTTGGFDRPRRY